MAYGLFSRQVIVDDNTDNGEDFWWTDKGQAIRWGILVAFLAAVALFILGGYQHAKRRMRKGLPPLAYHKWLLSRQQRALHDPSYRDPMPWYGVYRPNQYGPHNGQQEYGTEMYPPPVYDNAAPPPTYQPSQGGTKVDPSQRRSEPTTRPAEGSDQAPDYSGPSDPRPAPTQHPAATGSSSTSNNPYRA